MDKNQKNAESKVENTEKPAETKPKKKIKTIVFSFTISSVILIVLLVVFFVGYKKYTQTRYERSHALVEKQLSLCQEMVTAKYRYSDIIAIKKAMGFSKSYSIIKYTGILRAGIADFTDLEFTVSEDGKTVSVKMPKTELLGNDLVSQEVFDEKQSIFIPITTQEIFDEIEEARRETADDLLAEGFLSEARTYAIKIISQFLYAAGFENVRVD